MNTDKPSTTALFVANGMYYNIHQSYLKNEIPEDIKLFNSELITHNYKLTSSFSKRLHVLKTAIAQTFTIKGFYLHFLVRKKCIEHHVRQSLAEGFNQILILGAGYDTLCSRLANQFPEVQFFEIDHPATTKTKIKLFNDLNWNKSNITYLALDLQHIETLFSENKINTHFKTMVVCEGVLMYLKQAQVEQILNTLHKQFYKL